MKILFGYLAFVFITGGTFGMIWAIAERTHNFLLTLLP